MTRGLVLLRGHQKEPSMRASRTHFEQIPVEVVKKIAEAGAFTNQEIRTDNVIVGRTSKKAKPRPAPARSRARKGR